MFSFTLIFFGYALLSCLPPLIVVFARDFRRQLVISMLPPAAYAAFSLFSP